MSKVVKVIGVIAILIFVPKIVQKVMFRENVDQLMIAATAKANQELPKKIDNVTTATKVEYDPGSKTYRINYTMDQGFNIDPGKHDFFKSTAISQICGGPMKIMLDKKVTVEYLYTYSPDGRADQTMRIAVPPNSCA
ncbi:hypothetical protein ACO0LF_05070 [Undibacterium sp. Di27W]|uniref:hypothetical protein n=1 Tax=Undibacterium sp. Di27W TaxID=3413036 RepID=UPI003BF31EBF